MSLNVTLETSVGSLDLLGEVTGGGSYEDLLDHTIEVEVFGIRCRCLDLPALIQTKRAAGRPKDLEAIAELEIIWEEQQQG
jgi:predicted nucleotidyltransferase